jgi:hypothetical protein
MADEKRRPPPLGAVFCVEGPLRISSRRWVGEIYESLSSLSESRICSPLVSSLDKELFA